MNGCLTFGENITPNNCAESELTYHLTWYELATFQRECNACYNRDPAFTSVAIKSPYYQNKIHKLMTSFSCHSSSNSMYVDSFAIPISTYQLPTAWRSVSQSNFVVVRRDPWISGHSTWNVGICDFVWIVACDKSFRFSWNCQMRTTFMPKKSFTLFLIFIYWILHVLSLASP